MNGREKERESEVKREREGMNEKYDLKKIIYEKENAAMLGNSMNISWLRGREKKEHVPSIQYQGEETLTFKLVFFWC